jgi:hypothetical protein
VTALARRFPAAMPAMLALAAVTSLATGFLWVRQPWFLAASIAGVAALALAVKYLTAPRFALVGFILYLPLDWLVVLGLDSVGLSAGRLIRPLLTIGLAAACFFARGSRGAVPLAIAAAVGLVVGISLLQLFNPGLPDLQTAAIGVQTRILPLTLLPAGLYLALRPNALTNLTRALVWVTIVSAVVIVVQLSRGDTLVAVLGLNYPVFGVSQNGVPINRYPGPFLGAGLSMTMMFAFAAFVGFGHLLRRGERLLLGVAWLSWLVLLFANNQRSLFLFLLVDAPLVLLIGRFRNRLRRVPLALLLLVPAVLIAGSTFATRARSITDDPRQAVIQQHIVDPYATRVVSALKEAPLGRGLGTVAPGTRFLSDDTTFQTTPESFMAATIRETGILGLAAYLVLFALVAGALLQRALTAEDVTTRRFCAACLAITLWVMQLAVTYEPLSYYPFGPLYWLFVGLALGLPRRRADAA